MMTGNSPVYSYVNKTHNKPTLHRNGFQSLESTDVAFTTLPLLNY